MTSSGTSSNNNLHLPHSHSQQALPWRARGGSPTFERQSTMTSSISHPHLGFSNGGSKRSSGSSQHHHQMCDQGTQTPANIKRETRRCKLKGFKLNLNSVTPPINLNLRFLSSKNKRPSLSANAVATEQKATKVLGVVFFTFVFCWSPFFILNIFFAVCPNYHVPEYIVDICLWLGYVSSTINPIIYTIFNRTFRAAFIRLLKCDCEK